MFERFRDSLAYPGRIIQYRNDKMLRILSYLLLFAALMSITTVINTIRFDKLENAYVEVFEEQLVKTNINCDINSSTLSCSDVTITEFYNDGFINAYVDPLNEYDYGSIKFAQVSVVFNEEFVNVSMSGMKYQYTIAELTNELEGLDFNTLESDSEAFSLLATNAVSEVMKDMKMIWGPIVIGAEVFLNILFIVLIVLINSFIIKNRFKIIPFKEVFKMSVYSSTTLFVLLTLNNMISLGFFFLFIFVLITFRQTNALTMAIYKVMKKK